MKITLITACYNSAATIRTAIDSVLSQKGVDIEYIIVPTTKTFAPFVPTASGRASRSSTSNTFSRFGGLCLGGSSWELRVEELGDAFRLFPVSLRAAASP